MLNEIFKGMDNAAEKINENFQSLLISTGENEKGTWVRIPLIKLQICWKEINIPNTMTSTIWEYPMAFSETPKIFSHGNGDYNTWRSVRDENQVTMHSSSASGQQFFDVLAIGFY